jgi:hypothetical protein
MNQAYQSGRIQYRKIKKQRFFQGVFSIEKLPWFKSLWFRGALLSVVFVSLFTGLITGAPTTYLVGQVLLCLSVFISFRFLADYPLLNPIQAVIAIFYWWFGVGPMVVASYKALVGFLEDAHYAQVSAIEALIIVACGLPLYAVGARLALIWFSRKGTFARFLMPDAGNYKLKTIITLLLVGGISDLIIWILQQMGIVGIQETTYLGGTITYIWWVGVIANVSFILVFAKSSILTELVHLDRHTSKVMILLGTVVISLSLFSAITAGSKGAFLMVFLFLTSAYISKKQRIPWMWILVVIAAYLFFVEPFVTTGRHLAERFNIKTSAERRELFRELYSKTSLFELAYSREINVESLFRSVYPIGSEITSSNTLLEGEWRGLTIELGFLTLIPRGIYPSKPDLNIGNFFAQTVGYRMGIIDPRDSITNISITIPFEMVGNFGWAAGVLSFGIIGLFWAVFCAWVLSPKRLATHPLTPWLVCIALNFEAPLGHFFAGLRGFIIPMLILWLLWLLFGKHL